MKEHVLISSLTTMRLGGPARYVAEVSTLNACVEAYSFASASNLPTYILGGGSNVIGRDEGFAGVVLLNRLSGIEVITESEDGAVLKAASGEELDALAEFAAARGWSGIEALSAIPGTLGGAVMQNAGAYGQEIADVLVSVEAYDTVNQKTVVLERSQLDLAYRHSIFNSSARGRYFILSATVKLGKKEMEGELFWSLQTYLNERKVTERTPRVIRDAVLTIRAQKLPDPLVEASSGSFFKNVTLGEGEREALLQKCPDVSLFKTGQSWKLSSGWLIEQCGFKGKLLHGMRVSSKTALILINESASSYEDLVAARAEIVASVREAFGFMLEQEPEELV